MKISNKEISNKILIVFLILVILIILLVVNQRLIATTDKREYLAEETLKVNLRNYFFSKSLCFSSCYPYFIEKGNGTWKAYKYQECQDSDKVEKCVRPGELLGFAIPLPKIENGAHRISIPVYKDGEVGQDFEENFRFYSNIFEIKEK